MTKKPLDAKTIWRKSVKMAVSSPTNVISGAVAVAASAAFWNPLPLILWGLGATGWTVFASTGKSIQKKIEDEERQEREAAVAAQREALRQKVEVSLNEPPVGAWVRRGVLPDYMQAYRRLVDLRDKVAKVLKDREETETFVDSGGVAEQMDYMLTAYLNFVRERLVYVYILANLRASAGQEDSSTRVPAATPPPPPPAGFAANRWERVTKTKPVAAKAQEPSGPSASSGLPSIEQRLQEIDAKVAKLKELAQKEPATARTREWHMGILQKQRELLLECQKRDQCVVAQLGAFQDVFEVILGRVSASQFSATEVAAYMGSVVSQIEETERFVASMQPAMDELMGGIDPALNRWSASTPA
ncbi:MAG TPA: hypothetical protein VH394_15265 [Thermoanaerobaculia bacterium]|jgi:hypothetical protein|nr:hypothetical protein [Thermoanaerobaculia bacterium]